MDDFKVGLMLMGLALGLGSFAWATLKEREQVKLKSADLMRSIFELSSQYLELFEAAEATVREQSVYLTEPDDIEFSKTLLQSLRVWHEINKLNLGNIGQAVFMHAVKHRRVDVLILAHFKALGSVARLRELLATPNFIYLQWVTSQESTSNLKTGN